MGALWSTSMDEVRRQGPTIWLGVVGYEERATASLERLVAAGVEVEDLVAINYQTKLVPAELGSELVLGNVKRVRAALATAGAPSLLSAPRGVDPYRASDIARTLRSALDRASRSRSSVVVDISCMTGVNCIGIARTLDACRSGDNVFIAYTSPRQYNASAWGGSSGAGWIDTVIAPMSPLALLDATADSRGMPSWASSEAHGLALLGHEPTRLEWAFRNLMPSRALFVLAETGQRDATSGFTRVANDKVIAATALSAPTQRMSIDKHDLDTLRQVTEAATSGAWAAKDRLVLYPFGPRSFILASTLAVLAVSASAGWYVYPVPEFYRVDFAVGSDATAMYAYSFPGG